MFPGIHMLWQKLAFWQKLTCVGAGSPGHQNKDKNWLLECKDYLFSTGRLMDRQEWRKLVDAQCTNWPTDDDNDIFKPLCNFLLPYGHQFIAHYFHWLFAQPWKRGNLFFPFGNCTTDHPGCSFIWISDMIYFPVKYLIYTCLTHILRLTFVLPHITNVPLTGKSFMILAFCSEFLFSIKSPLLSFLKLLYQSKAWCQTIHMKTSLICMWMNSHRYKKG